MARAMARHAAAQQNAVARNLANADTPGYRAQRLPDFSSLVDHDGLALRATRASHLDAPGSRTLRLREETGNGNPNGNSVSLEAEMVQAALARQQHEMALAVQSTLSGVLRKASGVR